MKKIYITLGLVAIVAIATASIVNIMLVDNREVAATGLSENTKATNNTFSDKTQGSDEGGVVVGATPIDNQSFNISLDTHTTDLNEDLVEVSVLIDDKGKEYKPTSWDGDPPGGHHRSGVLTFEKIGSDASEITLIIKEVGDVEKREFTWDL